MLGTGRPSFSLPTGEAYGVFRMRGYDRIRAGSRASPLGSLLYYTYRQIGTGVKRSIPTTY